jgi:hypothetical protein
MAEQEKPTQGHANNVKDVTEAQLGIGSVVEYQRPVIGAFPDCYVRKHPDHEFRWLDQPTREYIGWDYWEPVPHDSSIDSSMPGPGGTVRRGSMFLGYRPKAIGAQRKKLIMEEHNKKLQQAKRMTDAAKKLAGMAKDGVTGEFEHLEGKPVRFGDLEEIKKLKEDLGLDDDE